MSITHGARLVERSDHVLAERVIDAGLAADRRIHLREQRRRHLHERHPALVDRRGEAGDVADHAAAERHERRRALRAGCSSSRVSTSWSVDHDLCVSPSGTRIDSLPIPAADRLARSGASQSAATTGLLTITTRGRGSSGASSAPASRSSPGRRGSRSCARPAQRACVCMPVMPASGSCSAASSCREKRAISSRLDSTTMPRLPGRADRATSRARPAARADPPR